MISIRHLGKWYGRRKVLEDITFDVPEGEALIISGSSGSGKSTLLRLIAGLEGPDSGEIFFDENLVSSPDRLLPPYRRSLGMVFQNPSLWPHMTVKENIGFGVYTVTGTERDIYVTDLLKKAHIEGLADTYPHQLSGGEARRVAILRAIAPRPKILLMDEPMVHLDPPLKKELLQLVIDYFLAYHATLIYVTHDAAEGQRITDNRIILREGVIIPDDEGTYP